MSLLLAKIAGVVRKKLSDIEYMSRIANGEIGGSSSVQVFAQGEVAKNTTGEIAAYIPATGKDFYLAHAGIFPESGDVGNNNHAVVEVKNDTLIRDVLGGWSAFNAPGGGNEGGQGAPFFKAVTGAIGDKLIGNGVKKYSLNCETNDGIIVHGSIIGFIVNAGASPKA